MAPNPSPGWANSCCLSLQIKSRSDREGRKTMDGSLLILPHPADPIHPFVLFSFPSDHPIHPIHPPPPHSVWVCGTPPNRLNQLIWLRGRATTQFVRSEKGNHTHPIHSSSFFFFHPSGFFFSPPHPHPLHQKGKHHIPSPPSSFRRLPPSTKSSAGISSSPSSSSIPIFYTLRNLFSRRLSSSP